MIKSFVRGGQIALHSLRMFGQVFKITLGARCLLLKMDCRKNNGVLTWFKYVHISL